MYHIALDLSQEQVYQLKVLAATTSTTVKDLVTKLVVDKIEKRKREETKKE